MLSCLVEEQTTGIGGFDDQAAAIVRIGGSHQMASVRKLLQDSADAGWMQQRRTGKTRGIHAPLIDYDTQHAPLLFSDTCLTQRRTNGRHYRFARRKQVAGKRLAVGQKPGGIGHAEVNCHAAARLTIIMLTNVRRTPEGRV